MNPFSLSHRVSFRLNPLSEFLSNWWLGYILCPWSSNWRLRYILSPWLGNWWLRNVFNVSLLYGWRLNILNVFNWISRGNDSLNSLVSIVLDIIPSWV